MKRFSFILFLPFSMLLISFMQPEAVYNALPVQETIQQQSDSVYSPVEVDSVPVFPGGDAAYVTFIRSKIVYPQEAKAKKIFGSVYVSFVVWSDGSIGRVHVVRSAHEILNGEAIRVIKAMPNWKPAEINNVPVACKDIRRIYFELR
ncbi:MAG: energy transducer TonB [Bacteroidia bacterium]